MGQTAPSARRYRQTDRDSLGHRQRKGDNGLVEVRNSTLLSEKPLRFPTPEMFNLNDSDLLNFLSQKHLIYRHYQTIMLGMERGLNMTKRIATYLRVSTKHHGQNLDTQRFALQEYAKNRGF